MLPTWGQNRSTSAADKPGLDSESSEQQLQALGWAESDQAGLPHSEVITGSA